ncbi:hypothetical protein [Chryseobacterium sp.]|uniref:hypothetical protein n=1 Tax=Chryseobacterium sp. TaxID=1871047 RepID=UPI0028975E72|nr:hypothetical protein [Chryseobacterium sp.]
MEKPKNHLYNVDLGRDTINNAIEVIFNKTIEEVYFSALLEEISMNSLAEFVLAENKEEYLSIIKDRLNKKSLDNEA